MGIFDVLSLMGGLSLFLFGMNIMGQALEKKAGSKLRVIIENITKNKFYGLFIGLVVTAVIQSSSATTVMVVGFVNSGIMTFKESISVIMGANIGTTVTSWILSLTGISSSNVFIKLLKPSSFTPILSFVGVIFYVFMKGEKKKDLGLILLGFATLMFGMEHMTGAVSSLKDVKEFRNLLIAFDNPLLGIATGAIITAIIQSSSASVGILQSLSSTGIVSYGQAIPIIMGQNIGTCVTALISSIGTNKNAKRASLFHLIFNITGALIFVTLFIIIKKLFSPLLFKTNVDMMGIAVVHSVFNISCTLLLFPFSAMLEKLINIIVKDELYDEKEVFIDERLMRTPSIAINECRNKTIEMCKISFDSLKNSIHLISDYNEDDKNKIIEAEKKVDIYEDKIGTYIVKLSQKTLSKNEMVELNKYLKSITDFERISDHSLNISESVYKLYSMSEKFSEDANNLLIKIVKALLQITTDTIKAFETNDINMAYNIEPLEQVIDLLIDNAKKDHILRLQKGKCDFSIGLIYNDILTDIERVSDHCSNIAGLIIDEKENNFNTHLNINRMKNINGEFEKKYNEYLNIYLK